MNNAQRLIVLVACVLMTAIKLVYPTFQPATGSADETLATSQWLFLLAGVGAVSAVLMVVFHGKEEDAVKGSGGSSSS